jgi:hypothetical protein
MTKTVTTPTNHKTANTGPPPPPGTRVQLNNGTKHQGIVMPYTPRESPAWRDLFPVRLDNWIWQICGTDDITVIAPPTQTNQ